MSPNGIVWTAPRWWRNCRLRTEIRSTVPLTVPRSMYSPRRNASSIRKNTPDTTSLTSACAPNPMARPITPAPAISGPTLTPRLDNAAKRQVRPITTRAVVRKSGNSVAVRLAPSPPSASPLSSSLASGCSAATRKSMIVRRKSQMAHPITAVSNTFTMVCMVRPVAPLAASVAGSRPQTDKTMISPAAKSSARAALPMAVLTAPSKLCARRKCTRIR
mmetsp:Transcript_29296/g.56904  ORF Transcript_29296/g.56904 Transcript_29296/m.56904 type:complete len:218 (+) Transcript_29296:3303-3956(+)